MRSLGDSDDEVVVRGECQWYPHRDKRVRHWNREKEEREHRLGQRQKHEDRTYTSHRSQSKREKNPQARFDDAKIPVGVNQSRSEPRELLSQHRLARRISMGFVGGRGREVRWGDLSGNGDTYDTRGPDRAVAGFELATSLGRTCQNKSCRHLGRRLCLDRVVIPAPLLCQFRHSPIVRHGMQTRDERFQFIGLGLRSRVVVRLGLGFFFRFFVFSFFHHVSKLKTCKLLRGCFEASPKWFSSVIPTKSANHAKTRSQSSDIDPTTRHRFKSLLVDTGRPDCLLGFRAGLRPPFLRPTTAGLTAPISKTAINLCFCLPKTRGFRLPQLCKLRT